MTVRPTRQAHTEKPSKKRPSPQDPTTCQTPPTRCAAFHRPTPKGKPSTHNNHHMTNAK
jgi:hypothetical protein